MSGFDLSTSKLATLVLLAPLVLLTPVQGALLFGGSFIVGGLVLIYRGFDKWQRARIIQDTPTEKIRSAAAGRTELKGIARPLGQPIQHPFGDGNCIAAAYKIEKLQKRRKTKTIRRKWKTISTGLSIEPFELDDGTGTIRVDAHDVRPKFSDEYTREMSVKGREEPPPGLVEFVNSHTDEFTFGLDGVTGMIFSEPRRYTVQWIPAEEELYVLGGAEPVESDDTTTSDLAMREDDASGLFFISPMSESDLISEDKRKAALMITGGVVASTFGVYILLSGLGF